jgi:hypothetical protein
MQVKSHLELLVLATTNVLSIGTEAIATIGDSVGKTNIYLENGSSLIGVETPFLQKIEFDMEPRESELPLDVFTLPLWVREQDPELARKMATTFKISCRVDFDARLSMYHLFVGSKEVISLDRRNVGSGVGNLLFSDGTSRAVSAYGDLKFSQGALRKVRGPLYPWSAQVKAIAKKALTSSSDFRKFWAEFKQVEGDLLADGEVESVKYSREQLGIMLRNHFEDIVITSPAYIAFVISSKTKVLASASGLRKENLQTSVMDNVQRRLKTPLDIFTKLTVIDDNIIFSNDTHSLQFFVNTSA